LEFDREREVAGGQLRLRPREPSRKAVVQRSPARPQAGRSERPRAAQRLHRPAHPAAGSLREGVGRGEVGLKADAEARPMAGGAETETRSTTPPATPAGRRRRRFDLTAPTLLGLPVAWLIVFFVVPIGIVAAYSVDALSITNGPHPLTFTAWRRL